MNAISGCLGGLVVREAVVIHSGLLVREVFQAVPLRARLRVDVHLIVESSETKRGEITERLSKTTRYSMQPRYHRRGMYSHYFLLELLPAKAREFHILQTPIELDVLAGADLVGSSADYVRREEVEGSHFIFHAVLVEEAPQTALRLIFDFRELVEIWKMEVRVAGEGAGHG